MVEQFRKIPHELLHSVINTLLFSQFIIGFWGRCGRSFAGQMYVMGVMGESFLLDL